jgi:hypothetical protein
MFGLPSEVIFFADAVIAENGTLALSFLANAHPVVVQIVERWTKLSGQLL